MSDLLETVNTQQNVENPQTEMNELFNTKLNLNNNNDNITENKTEIENELNNNQTLNLQTTQAVDSSFNSKSNNTTLNHFANQNCDSNLSINNNEKTEENDIKNNNDESVVQPHVSMIKDENGFVYYRCRFCGLTFNFMTTLKAHERVHNVDQPYLCNKCGESFHFMCELEYHSKSHLKQKGYKCDCGRTFFQYTDMLYHRHPDEDKEPIIPILEQTKCLKQSSIDVHEFPVPEFKEKGFEPKHPLKVYSDVRTKPYICQYCSKSYADSRGLAYHMYSHRGEKIFNPRASRYLMCRNENSYISPGVSL